MRVRSLLQTASVMGLALAIGRAHAGLPGEDAIFNAPLQLELERGGPTVKVHYAIRHAHLDIVNAGVSLAALKAAAQECVDKARQAGREAMLPAAWPRAGAIEYREEGYYAANRSIEYTRSVTYSIDPATCALRDKPRYKALLMSSQGMCTIDFDARSTEGRCPADGFASAKISPTPAVRRDLEAKIKKQQANPMMVESLRFELQGLPKRTGKFKTVAGLRCELVALGDKAEGGTECRSHQGGFLAHSSSEFEGRAGMLLQYDSPGNGRSDAVKAGLDVTVSAALFVPYLARSFQQ